MSDKYTNGSEKYSHNKSKGLIKALLASAAIAGATLVNSGCHTVYGVGHGAVTGGKETWVALGDNKAYVKIPIAFLGAVGGAALQGANGAMNDIKFAVIDRQFRFKEMDTPIAGTFNNIGNFGSPSNARLYSTDNLDNSEEGPTTGYSPDGSEYGASGGIDIEEAKSIGESLGISGDTIESLVKKYGDDF
jgi:hypothetical protein